MEIHLQVVGNGMNCNRIAYLRIVYVGYLVVRLIFADIENYYSLIYKTQLYV